MNIVLVHGVLGFGRLPSLVGLPVVRYFNGVAEHLGRSHRVVEPSQNPIGSVAERGDQLAAEVARLQLGPGEKVHIIAHSMGGLDARHAIALRTGPLVGRLPTWLADYAPTSRATMRS